MRKLTLVTAMLLLVPRPRPATALHRSVPILMHPDKPVVLAATAGKRHGDRMNVAKIIATIEKTILILIVIMTVGAVLIELAAVWENRTIEIADVLYGVTMEESGVSVACQEALLVKRGWNINSNTLAAIITSIMFSIPSPPFIPFSLKRNAAGGDNPGYRRAIMPGAAPSPPHA